ncbi:hypothetical protein ACFP3U_17915 [Kitasatospora misakiensis]|uniref:DUF3592 domain-containing protein n=1 Tax=Kitasatospora misakiensis TaxID=67330 RepID=A0ABW0X337_9ACTN
MNARIKDARPPGGFRRIAGPVVRVVTQALFLLTGLATTVLGFTWFVDGYHAVGAHRHAPACGTAAATPGTDCVLHESGKVTARKVNRNEDSTTYSLTVTREKAPKHTYDVGKAFYNDAKVGTDVDLAIFRGRVVELSYHGHRAENPITPWLTSFKVALLAGLGTLLTAHGLTWWRSGANSVPVVAGGFTAFVSFFGALVLMSTQWALALTLGLSVLGWLLLTAATTAATMDG